MRLRLIAAAVLALAAGVLAWPALAAADPPSLTGETFTATFVESVGNCDSPTPTILWHARGTATGPYPGTFDETGRFVLNAAGTGFNFGPLVDATTSFTINSIGGRVFGMKRFTTGSAGIAHCQILATPLLKYKEVKATNLSYTALILAGPFYGGGLWVDCGVSPDLFFDNSTARSPVPQVFGETFLSDGKTALPLSAAGECF
jgi:hypothetical protein